MSTSQSQIPQETLPSPNSPGLLPWLGELLAQVRDSGEHSHNEVHQVPPGEQLGRLHWVRLQGEGDGQFGPLRRIRKTFQYIKFILLLPAASPVGDSFIPFI